MLASFDTGGHTYRISKLNAFDQFNIARRLSQALVPLGNLRQAADERPDDKALALAFVTLAANLAEDDVTKSMTTLLASVERSLGAGQGWARITTPQGTLMYEDIDLVDLNVIIVKTLDANRLIDFFVAPPSGSPGP